MQLKLILAIKLKFKIMKSIKKVQLSILLLFLVNVVAAQGKPTSSKETATGKINGATISINYGSPSVNGRQIWGALVPFDQVWRAGANDATTFETDKDVLIEGSKLPAGKYSFFIIPNEKNCIVIFNKVAKQWGAYKYKATEDQLRVTVQPQTGSSVIEKLVYKVNTNSVVLSWEQWNIPITIQ